jgi:putative FmdB family regulatory protein
MAMIYLRRRNQPMPIYEFYCDDCHTVFNFFSRRIDTERRPRCPRCGRPDLERWLSVFAISKARTGSADEVDDGMGDMDEARMLEAFDSMSAEFAGMNEEDPRQAARLMRRLFESVGLRVGEHMDEAIRRMEAGEDPDRIEQDMGDVLDDEAPIRGKAKHGIPSVEELKALRRKLLPPKRDETLYTL